MHSTAVDSNSSNSNRTDKVDRRTWPQIVQEQFISSPELFNDLTKKKTVKQEVHIRESKAHESQTEMSGHSSEDQGRLDCNTVDGQERCLHAD